MFRAYDAERERLVAVKLFKLDLPPERVHQLVAEFERIIAADLTHPVLAAPLAAGIHDVCAYLVQEYVAADSLDLVVREYGPAPPADALRVAAQLAGALDFAAAVNITHGALHPRDVLLSSDETSLTGTGITRALERIGVGAPLRRPYTPPERIAGAEWDRRADVFSLAALMHELLWGRRVNGIGAQAADGLTDIADGDLGALRGVFARALAENPSDRYETALEFAKALKNGFPDVVAAPAPVPVPPPPPAPPRQAARTEVAPPQLSLLEQPAARREVALPFATAQEVAQPIKAADDATHPIAVTPDLSLSLAAAEEERYRDVEAAPAIVAPAMIEQGIPLDQPMFGAAVQPVPAPEPEVVSRARQSRSGSWPIALALGVGLMIGFAAGFGVGTRDRPAPAASALTPAAPPVRGREFTESAVATPPAAAPPRASAERTNADVRSTPNDGRLLVRSTPAGARVFVDGKDYGRTPAVVRDLARGTHRLRILGDGYAIEERQIAITAARPSQSITVPLSRPRGAPAARSAPAARPPAPARPAPPAGRFIGALSIVSRPPGAAIFVDGKHVGTTPMSLSGLTAGSHAVRLELEGYRRWTSAVRVVANVENRVTASLER